MHKLQKEQWECRRCCHCHTARTLIWDTWRTCQTGLLWLREVKELGTVKRGIARHAAKIRLFAVLRCRGGTDDGAGGTDLEEKADDSTASHSHSLSLLGQS